MCTIQALSVKVFASLTCVAPDRVVDHGVHASRFADMKRVGVIPGV